MKVILSMAMSVNGMIATPDFKEDFLSDKNWWEFVKQVDDCGCLIWGRRTYEQVKDWPEKYFNSLKKYTKVILSKNKNLKLLSGFELANSPEAALKLLKDKGYAKVILTGGSKNNSSFAKEGLIDEIIVDVEPALLGKGIPLFDSEVFEARLKLKKLKKVSDSLVQLHYTVIH